MTEKVHATELLLFSVLLQLIVMIAAARLMNLLATRLGQPGVIGEIVAGLLLGPSLLGTLFPDLSAALFGGPGTVPITIISQLGLILLMFQIGTEFEFGHLRESRYFAAVLRVAAVSVLVPLLLGVAVGLASADSLAPGIDRLAFALFCGVAVAITAVPILGRILREFGLSRHPLGVVAISAAALNDVVGWVLLAFVSAYAAAQFSLGFVAWRLLLLAGTAVFAWFVLRPLAVRLLRAFPVRNGAVSPDLMAIVLGLMFALGILTNAIGIFTIFGGFLAGLLFHRDDAFVSAWRNQVGRFVLVFFLPVFFTFTGLRTNVLGLSSGSDLAWLAAILAVSVAGKVIPVYWAGRRSGFDPWQSAVLGSLMNTRALMELIVLNIGYDLGVLPQRPFTMLVIMAVATTLMTGPLLQRLLPRAGHVAERVAA